jgi:hypothetical protein
MATVDELQDAVKKLEQTVRRLARGGNAADNAARVNEIVDPDGDERPASPPRVLRAQLRPGKILNREQFRTSEGQRAQPRRHALILRSTQKPRPS